MKLLIFDFDGTIVDTKALYYDAIYRSVKHLGYSYKDIDKVIDMGANLRKTLRRLGLSFILVPLIKYKVMKDVRRGLNKVKECRDVDSIKNIKEEKILVTNSLKSAVYPLLKHYKLRKTFREVYGFEDFVDKGDFIKSYISKKGLDKDDVFYIGDRATDIKVARAAGCHSVIIYGKCAWDSKKEILKAKPDYLIHNIKNLKKTLKKA